MNYIQIRDELVNNYGKRIYHFKDKDIDTGETIHFVEIVNQITGIKEFVSEGYSLDVIAEDMVLFKDYLDRKLDYLC